VGFYGFFVGKSHRNPDKGVARKLRFLGSFCLAVSAWQFPPGSLQGKKSSFSRF
jgi:hypothetical protein